MACAREAEGPWTAPIFCTRLTASAASLPPRCSMPGPQLYAMVGIAVLLGALLFPPQSGSDPDQI